MTAGHSETRRDPGFCRDCLAPAAPKDRRCRACGSPRILRHPELDTLSVAHLDCDAFYAAIEKRDNPDLRDKPLIIGGGRRGVVSTACYIARINGVHSAMPMFKALKLCPDAVVLRPDMEKYAAVGREVRALMEELTPLVEPLSIDEAFLDLTGTERLHGRSPALTLAALARRIEKEIGITVSVGLAPNKFLAKVASDLDKPRGFSVIGRADIHDFLADQPVSIIWGAGRTLCAKLARDGIHTIGHLQRKEKSDLMRRYGSMGARLYHLARGEDHRRVTPHGAPKSISSETTFEDDLADPTTLEKILWRLCEKVSRRAKASGYAGTGVALKLKTASFRIRTRHTLLSEPTQLAERIYRAARPLLARETDGTAFRLIGVGIDHLADADGADPESPLDPTTMRLARAEHAMDKLRARFGRDAVDKGLVFTPRPKAGHDE
ncbi:DNA polymerase IV [Kaustia mangrovi]|uniref:DNA polymerase IV n=1 Tax=Kaustia mangrovi TaxID=2593653 RepID=A0A7S8C1F6_9HYPH|nr:DNA polymerase IV [Kaustia mangrovi]QPC41620.1 DNA polymerase IV [Kaustia mangrovi]